MAEPIRIFISYSHDSDDHAGRVVELADALCGGGIDVILGQYVDPAPEEGWPRWMDRNLDEAKFVLMVCTETYRRRVMGQGEPGKGLGVRWEGSLIYNRIYHDKPSSSRFIPILLRPGSETAHIPNPVQGHAYYRITTFDLTDPGYEALYRHLTDQPATPKPGIEPSDEWDLLPAPIIEKGRVVFGKYLLEEKIGEGGMGQVWRVENIPLQRESALKLINPKYAQNEKGWRRFEREARLMAKITHPNAVAVYDFRRTHSMAYIEMEFVPGCSLDKYLNDKKTPMPLEWTAQLLDELCSVLQEAHGHVDKRSGKAKPIIHRDLKPSNLMLVEGKPDGQNLKVLDFGIAKMIQDEGSPELTGQGESLGTPYYMSPEQIQGGVGKDGRGELDGRSDLYSVGVLLYQLLTGSLPFMGRNHMEVLVAHLHNTPPPMKEANPNVQVSPQVERLVMKCLEKDPDLRPQSARELADRFRAAIGDIKEPRPLPHPGKPCRRHPGAAPKPSLNAPEHEWTMSIPPPQVEISQTVMTAYYPKEVEPLVWHQLHTYIFRESAESQVDADARERLGERINEYRRRSKTARRPIAKGSTITATPRLEGFQFNPPSQAVELREDWHRLDFRLRARPELAGMASNGLLTFTVEGVIVADIPISIYVRDRVMKAEMVNASAGPYRSIFCSYSRQDTCVVKRVERACKTLGIDYLRDVSLSGAANPGSPRCSP